MTEDTRDIFNQIAPGWYSFRHWSRFRAGLEVLAQRWQGGRLLNIGCAHGPDFLPFRQGFSLFGVDFATEMLARAREYSRKFAFTVNLVAADAAHLPFQDEVFDGAIAVATYHHISDERERRLAFIELRRVLKPGGEAFVTVWNRWQRRFWFRGREVAVPWRLPGKTLKRYHYLFSYPEIERLVREVGFSIIGSFPEDAYHFPVKIFSRNICLIVKRD